MDLPLIVRVFYKSNYKFIVIDRDKLTFQNFVEIALKEFGEKFEYDSNRSIYFTDNLGTEIKVKHFENVIKTFHSGSNFFVNLMVSSSTVRAPTSQFVTAAMLESYLSKFYPKMLEYKNAEDLPKKSRSALMRSLIHYMMDTFGVKNTDAHHQQMTAKAAIELFPSLKMKCSDGDGTELLLKSSGFMSNRVKYFKRKATGGNSAVANKKSNTPTPLLSNGTDETDLLFLKNAVIRTCEQSLLIEKLNNTRQLRYRMLKDLKTDLRTSFPFFFSNAELILLYFEQEYKSTHDVDGLKVFWRDFGHRFEEICNSDFSQTVHTDWPKDIERILLPLKVLPSKVKRGRKRAYTEPFLVAVDRFIVFVSVGTPKENWINDQNDHPYIIAYGSTKQEILAFYLAFEKHIIPMPLNFGIVEAVDLFIKTHLILQQDFDESLTQMMTFFTHYIYKIPAKKNLLQVRLQEIYNRINMPMEA